MATTVGDVAVRVGADIEPLKRGMRQAGQATDRFGKQAAESAKNVAKITAAASAAAFVLGGAVVKSSLAAAKEMQNLARLANTSTNTFAKLAYGAKTLGIEEDKLSDILKDVNDRIGDFNATGGGPMADFFENIAPKVGVTADQFERLSGPEALQLYVDSLEKANLSQSDMTFYMETMASDATALLPLLRNGGEAMAAQATEAERLGIALTDIEYQRLAEAQVAFEKMGAAAQGIGNVFTAELAPTITAVAEEISRQFGEAGTDMREGIGGAVDFGVMKLAGFLEGAASVVAFIEDNQDLAKFGLLGYVILGKKGAMIGSAIGAAFGMIKEQLADFGVGITDAEARARQLVNVQKEMVELEVDIQNRLARIGNASPEDKSAFFASAQEAREELRAEEAALRSEIELSTESMDYFNALMGDSATAGDSLAESMRGVAEALRSSRTGGEEETTPAEDAAAEAEQVIAVQQEMLGISIHAYEQYYNRRKDAAQEAADEETRIAAEAAKAQADIEAANRKTILDEASKGMGRLSALMESEHKGMFEIGKAAAISQTVIDTYAAAQASYKALAGIPVVGPGLGAAAAAAAVAGGLARVSAISSREFGKGGTGSDPGAGAGSQADSQSKQAAQAPEEPDRVLRLETVDPSSLVSGQVVNQLAEQLVQYQKDGFQLVVS